MMLLLTIAYPISIIGGIWIYIKSIVDFKDKKDKKNVL